MEEKSYKDEILLRLTGDVLDCELSDATLSKILASSLREVQRYIDTTQLITIPYEQCIDLTKTVGNVSAVARVYRAEGYIANGTDSKNPLSPVDPMYASQWQLMAGYGNLYNMMDFTYNFAAYNTLLQMRNSISTDLAFRYDKSENKLYINIAGAKPEKITVEYIPQFTNVSQITSDYWIDVLLRVAVALSKCVVGRIRSKYKQSNALWELDGATLLEEGTKELDDLREKLSTNAQLVYPTD